MAEDYTMVPQRELEKLESEVAKLKSNPVLAAPQSRDLPQAIEQLQFTLDELLVIFAKASKKGSTHEDEMNQKLDLIIETQDALKAEIESIKESMSTLDDAFKELAKEEASRVASPQQFSTSQFNSVPGMNASGGAPGMLGSVGGMPPSMPPMAMNGGMSGDMPPPPMIGMNGMAGFGMDSSLSMSPPMPPSDGMDLPPPPMDFGNLPPPPGQYMPPAAMSLPAESRPTRQKPMDSSPTSHKNIGRLFEKK